jgi:hypothetical protein
MNRSKIKLMAAVALLSSLTAFASGCYYYGHDDTRDYYVYRDGRYERYPRYDPRYRYYDSRYGWRYRDRDRYYDNRYAWRRDFHHDD